MRDPNSGPLPPKRRRLTTPIGTKTDIRSASPPVKSFSPRTAGHQANVEPDRTSETKGPRPRPTSHHSFHDNLLRHLQCRSWAAAGSISEGKARSFNLRCFYRELGAAAIT